MTSKAQLQAEKELLQQENTLLKAQLLQSNAALCASNQQLAKAEEKNEALTMKLQGVQEQLNLVKLRQFNRTSEANLLQQNLFDELNVLDNQSSIQDATDGQAEGTTTFTVTRKSKNRPKRTPLPEHLERIIEEIDIDEADKVCECGCTRRRMGYDISEELIVQPAKLLIKQYRRYKYICAKKACENEKILINVLPPKLLPKTNCSASLRADIVTKKYVDHLPLYRQEQMWKRLEIILTRNTMCGWLMKSAEALKPLYQLLNQWIINYDIIHADETPVQVLKEPGRKNTKKSYIWTYKGGPPNQPIVFFEYQTGRGDEYPKAFLKNFKGYIISDAYTGYDWIDDNDKLIHIFCMSHARRPFAELVKLAKAPGKSHKIIQYFEQLYAVEKEAREKELTPEQRYQLRQEKSKPILDELFAYLEESKSETPATLKLGKAIHYMLKRKKGFYNYLLDGRLEIDNNAMENQIRPFALGRKNWMFLGSPKGAKAACIFYTLIQTAKLNNIEPQRYLETVFEKLPYCKKLSDFEQLLPWKINNHMKKEKGG